MMPDEPTLPDLRVGEEILTVYLSDGRVLGVPFAWYPRLLHGSETERNNWRPIGAGSGMHWPDLDEDISVRNLILGQPSGESAKSFQKWLSGREA